MAKYKLFIQKCSWLVLNPKQCLGIVLQSTRWPRPKACHVLFKQFNGKYNCMPLPKNCLNPTIDITFLYCTYSTKKTAVINIAGRWIPFIINVQLIIYIFGIILLHRRELLIEIKIIAEDFVSFLNIPFPCFLTFSIKLC